MVLVWVLKIIFILLLLTGSILIILTFSGNGDEIMFFVGVIVLTIGLPACGYPVFEHYKQEKIEANISSMQVQIDELERQLNKATDENIKQRLEYMILEQVEALNDYKKQHID